MGSNPSKDNAADVHSKYTSSFTNWWYNNKSNVINSIAEKAQVSVGVAAQAVGEAMPIMLSHGKDAAKKFLNVKFPKIASVAGVMLDSLEMQMQSQQSSGLKTGSGEPIGNFAYVDKVKSVGGYGDGIIYGGCGCGGDEREGGFTGGYIGADEMDIATVKDYANSVNSKAKEAIIQQVLDMATSLKIDFSGSDQRSKIKSLLEKITSRNFAASETGQKSACMKIAQVLNNHYGNEAIDMSQEPALMCSAIAEVISSLNAGMYSEFLAVHNDVRRILKNLEVLQDSLVKDYDLVKEKIRASDDPNLPQQITTLDDLHIMITKEIKRQIEMLKNLLNIHLLPAEKDLAGLIKNSKDLHGYIDKIDTKLGSEKFGRVIKDVLFGMGLTANYALLIEKALKTVGMTVAEYAENSSIKDLRQKITMNVMGKGMSEKELYEYLKAAELLYENLYRNKDIADTLSKTGKGEEPEEEAEMDDYEGGAPEFHKTEMDKRVENRRNLRTLIFNTFYKQINALYDQFIGALDVLSMKIGTEIPLSEQLNSFRHALQRVEERLVRNNRVYHALIGFYNDATSKSHKDQLIGELKMVSSYIDSIVELPQYSNSKQYFLAVQDQVQSMLKLIDSFSDEFSAKFGRGESCPYVDEKTGSYHPYGGDDEREDNIADGAYDNGMAYGGYEAEAAYGGGLYDEPALKYKSTKTINDAIRQFDYKYRVAQIRSNLATSGKELEHYSERYEKIKANSIADILENEMKKYKALSEFLQAQNPPPVPIAGAVDFTGDNSFAAEKKAAQDFLDAQWDAKKKFWATVEAVDTYAIEFTNGIVNNPDDVKDIKSMLDSVKIMNDWYSDRTGNDLAQVFDYFPAFMSEDSLVDGNLNYPQDVYREVEDGHYYSKVEKALNAGGSNMIGLPGNPYLVARPSNGKSAREQLKTTLSGLSVLKNFISVFVHIGSQFGGQELRKKVFLTPTQMYNNLIDYLQASAFSQGFGTGEILPKQGQAAADNPGFLRDDNQNVGINVMTGNNTVILGNDTYMMGRDSVKVGSTMSDAVNPENLFRKQYGVWMRSIHRDLREREGLLNFKLEDDYFVIILKTLAAKILTVVGLYDVFDRPHEYNGLSPIRMILGGNIEMPKIDEAAVPLYMRLPLLAQFYRNIFGFDTDYTEYGDVNNNELRLKDRLIKISMVPDVDGIFSGLIRLIFRKNKSVEAPGYSDEDVKDLIREINVIHQRMTAKSSQNIVMDTIHEFVAEINRRYGIVSKSDRNEYEKEFGYQYDYSDPDNTKVTNRYTEAPTTDIAILPGEEDDEVVRKSAAERLLGSTLDSSADKVRPYTVSPEHKRLLYKFRCSIDTFFENPQEEFTFNNAIKSVQQKLKHETNDEARLKLVASLMRGVDVYNKVDGLKCVLFQETVVSGLNVLSGIHSMLAKFKQRVLMIDLRSIESWTWKHLETAGEHTPNGLHTAIRDKLMEYGIFEGSAQNPNQEVLSYVQKIFGRDEARRFNGGYTNSNYFLKAKDGVPKWPVHPVGHANNGAPVSLYTIAATNGGPNGNFTGTIKNSISSDANNTGNDPFAGLNGGVATVLVGHSVTRMMDARTNPKKADEEDRRAADAFIRYIFDREFIMKELLETSFGISHDFQGMVDLRIENGKFILNYGGLRTAIEEMFRQISYFMDLLRPHIDASLFERYVNKINPGSYYWLQEQIMEKIIQGRPSGLDSKNRERINYASMDDLARIMSSTYQELTRNYDVNAVALKTRNIQADKNQYPAVPLERHSYDKVFAEMIFYDASKPQSGIIHSSETHPNLPLNNDTYAADGGLMIMDFTNDPYEGLMLSGAIGAKTLDTRYAARFKQLYSLKDEFTANRSAMFAFNQLVAKYLQTFYDPVSGKIYSGLINHFANGAFNHAVTDQLFTYPDTAPTWFVKYGAPSDLKLPNTRKLLASISPAMSVHLEPLKGLLLQFVQYGAVPNDQHLSELFSPSNPNTAGNSNPSILDNNAATAIGSSKLYVLLLLYAIGMTIEEGLRLSAGLGAATTVADANPLYPQELHNLILTGTVPSVNGAARPLAKANIGELRQIYNNGAGAGVVPLLQDIMRVLLNRGGGPDETALINRISYATVHDNKAAANIGNRCRITNGSIAGTVWGNNAIVAESRKLRNVIEMVLRLPDIEGNNNRHTQLVVKAAQIFPFLNNATGSSVDYKMELLAHMLVRMASEYQSNKPGFANGNFNTAIKETEGEVLGVASTYSGQSASSTKSTAKLDDLLNTVTTESATQNIQGQGDSNFLILARNGPVVNSGLNPNSLNGLDSRVHSAGTASDGLAAIQNFGKRLDPDSDHVLFTSLSVMFKNILTSRVATTQAVVYLQDNVADIAMYMKEKMRANLPFYRNLFNELSTRCEFIKQIMANPEMNLTRSYSVAPTHNPWPYTLKAVTQTSEETKNRFIGILDSVIKGCSAIVNSCDQTVREIGDDPKYLETYQGSIKDYKSQYGVDPLMPLSTTLAALKNTKNSNYLNFFPIHSLGEDEFKLMYGCRGILGSPTTKPMMEHIPGFGQLIDNFNLMAENKMQTDKTHADAYLKLYVQLLRYVFELKHVKGLLTPYMSINGHIGAILPANYSALHNGGLFVRGDLVLDGITPGSDAPLAVIPDLTNRSSYSIVAINKDHALNNKMKYPMAAYAIKHTLAESLRITESSFKDDKIKELVEHICARSSEGNNLEVQNIIDLGIVPINVHALMRSIPLASLYNYAYTFDRLIIELYYGLGGKNAQKLIKELCEGEYNYRDDQANKINTITSAKDMLVAMMLQPYREFGGDSAFAKQMLIGVANNGELGRPKFLSDQIYGKAIFGELPETVEGYNELGPITTGPNRGTLSDDSKVHLHAELMARVLAHLNHHGGNSRFAGALLANPVNTNVLHQFCVGIARYLNAHGAIGGNDLYNLIMTKFLHAQGPQELLSLRPAGGSSALAYIATIVAFLTAYPIRYLSDGINADAYTTDGLLEITATMITVQLQLLNAMGQNQARLGTGGVNDNAAKQSMVATLQISGPPQLAVFNQAIALDANALINIPRYLPADIPLRTVHNYNAKFTALMNALLRINVNPDIMTNNVPPQHYTTQNHLDWLKQSLRSKMENLRTGPFNPISNRGDGALHWLDVSPERVQDDLHSLELNGPRPVNNNSGPIPQPKDNSVIDSSQVRSVSLHSDVSQFMAQIGRLRLDTVLIRNLIFIVNLYRSLRMKLQRDLTYSKEIVLKSYPVTRTDLTEFFGNQVDSERQRQYGSMMYKRFDY